jgi:hypothetical protein
MFHVKHSIQILALVALALSAACTVNQGLSRALKQIDETILSEYDEYVKSDPDLPDAAKTVRLRHTETVRRLKLEAEK